MGVDYYECDACGLGYRDDSNYIAYCECGQQFCSKQCAKLKNSKAYDQDDPDFDHNLFVRLDKLKLVTCCICRKERHTTYVLLNALLKHYNLSIEDAEKIWRGQED